MIAIPHTSTGLLQRDWEEELEIGKISSTPMAQGENLLCYSTQLGRELLRSQYKPAKPITAKWQFVLPSTFQLKWKNTWDAERGGKKPT
jgi:hypothetical protein